MESKWDVCPDQTVPTRWSRPRDKHLGQKKHVIDARRTRKGIPYYAAKEGHDVTI